MGGGCEKPSTPSSYSRASSYSAISLALNGGNTPDLHGRIKAAVGMHDSEKSEGKRRFFSGFEGARGETARAERKGKPRSPAYASTPRKALPATRHAYA